MDYGDENRGKKMVLSRESGRIVFSSDPVSARASVRIRCGEHPDGVSLNGKAVAYDYDRASGVLNVHSEAGKALRVELLMP